MDKELFQKYLNNNCNPEELQETFRWLKEEAGSLHGKRMLEQFWKEYNSGNIYVEEDRVERMLDKLHHRLNLYNFEHKLIKNAQSTSTTFQRITFFLSRAAAILFIPVLLTLVYTWSRPNLSESETSRMTGNIEVVAPVGSRTFIELPDGTGVHLNHGSKLSYPHKFTGGKRRVSLSGEAYFVVTENHERPFLVDAGDLVVTALGTEFNVMAYSGQPRLETTLAQGKVLVQRKLPDNRLETLQEMRPGQHLSYLLEENSFSCVKRDIQKYILWKDGLLMFKDDPLEEITQRLARWYNVEFIFSNDSLKDYPFTATFVDETLSQALDLLCLAIPMDYQVTPRVKQPDGTFTKQKVIINSKK
ncbi:DUF4974 domain-containing protein [Mariniphaga sediminis]|uniref:DUF4974 domain-containing protein n=1 Tax=Mariniphaga sediminis TaxID=1628158 RepID=A0A399D6D5_9BACT|nr:FecR domain-containing protein [Mariniphaga sediminis]RIH67117.1 DUF4974 domain-containing protein [Mariniphaga sediminis]